jgi:hypothetical protein
MVMRDTRPIRAGLGLMMTAGLCILALYLAAMLLRGQPCSPLVFLGP